MCEGRARYLLHAKLARFGDLEQALVATHDAGVPRWPELTADPNALNDFARLHFAPLSTGALIAWLDGAIVIDNVVAAFQAVFNEALYDTARLARLVEEFMPTGTIADCQATGAQMFFVTSELDSARASVRNIGEIAQAAQYDLFRAIMRASAALPGLFSPVDLQYIADNRTYVETHVDGGVHMQFLAIPEFANTSAHRMVPTVRCTC